MTKKNSSDQEKLLKFEAEGPEFAKFLRSLEQFISSSERSEQFLETECFVNLFLEVFYVYNLDWKKLLGFINMQEKLENIPFSVLDVLPRTISFRYALITKM